MSNNATEAEVQKWLATIPPPEQEALKTCYAKGDPMPSGYVDAQDWAQAQYLHGLRQSQCAHGCKRWLFPQELEGHVCPAPKAKRPPSRSGSRE